MAESKNGTKIVLAVVAIVGVILLLCCGAGAWFATNAYHQVAGTAELPDGVTYSEWRDSFQSQLLKKGPAPQGYDDEPIPPNVTQVSFRSGDLQLKAWVYRPPEIESPEIETPEIETPDVETRESVTPESETPESEARFPALLFLHGGFAFGMGDLMACQVAMDRGFVVMAPASRGENGNPGNFEMFLGEADDAKAVAKWLAAQSFVDPDQIFVFGHSVGGGVSAMLPLLDDVPIQHSGSSGGLYPPTVFLGWAEDVPFRNAPNERMARLLIGNIKHMQTPHFAYLGQADVMHDAAAMAREEGGGSSLLTIEMVPGDHFTSFDRSLELYLDRIASERK